MFSVGSGDVKLSGNKQGESDLKTNALALGIDSVLRKGSADVALLTFKSNFNYSNAEVDANEDIAAIDSTDWRLRVALDISSEQLLTSGKLSQYIEIGARADGGDRQKILSGGDSIGSGVDFALGAKYSSNSGTKVEIFAKTLIAHSSGEQEEYNISLNLSHTSNNGGKGLQLSLRPVWGKSIDKDVWSDKILPIKAKKTSGNLSYKPDNIAFRVGYNLHFSDIDGLFKPYSEFNRSGENNRSNIFGVAFVPFAYPMQLEVFNKQESSATSDKSVWTLQGKYKF